MSLRTPTPTLQTTMSVNVSKLYLPPYISNTYHRIDVSSVLPSGVPSYVALPIYYLGTHPIGFRKTIIGSLSCANVAYTGKSLEKQEGIMRIPTPKLSSKSELGPISARFPYTNGPLFVSFASCKNCNYYAIQPYNVRLHVNKSPRSW